MGDMTGIKRDNKELLKVVIKLILNGANICFKNELSGLYPYYEALVNNYVKSHNQIKNRMDTILNNKEKYSKEFELMYDWIEEEKENDFNDKVEKFVKITNNIINCDEKDVLKEIDQYSGIIYHIDNHGQNALHYAIEHYKPLIVKKLIIMGIDLNRQNTKGLYPINLIANLGNIKGRNMFYVYTQAVKERDKLFEKKIEEEMIEKKNRESSKKREELCNQLINDDELKYEKQKKDKEEKLNKNNIKKK